jgi:hypothetical protein
MSSVAAALPVLDCPLCGKPMILDALPHGGPAQVAGTYEDCLRRCATCRVGFSNARTTPTLIHSDPLGNLPVEVRPGALQTLSEAINIRNRDNKIRKFGFSTSEDAVTWTMFSFLGQHRPDALASLVRTVFGLRTSDLVNVLLWGVPITPAERGATVQQALLRISSVLGENPVSRSEPDVILDLGDAGVIVIEVKFGSANDRRTDANWGLYLTGMGAFSDPEKAQGSGLYELVRNWRIAHDLADGRPFTVVNLAPSSTLAATDGMDHFASSLRASPTAQFLPLTWDSFLTAVETVSGGLPPWLGTYLQSRGLRDLNRDLRTGQPGPTLRRRSR